MRVMLPVKRWISSLVSVYQESRKQLRIPAHFEATLSGPFGMLYVTGVDATRDGAGVQSTSPLELGTLVFLRIESLGLMGFAHVRHCSARAGGYLLGLEFREPLARDHRDAGDWSRERVRRDAVRVWDDADVS